VPSNERAGTAIGGAGILRAGKPARAGDLGVFLLLGALCLSGCAAGSAYRQGVKAGKRGDWDVAVARLTLALERKPDSIQYRLALENARVEASRSHYAAAKKALAAQQLEKAADELEIAAKFDPSNKAISDDLVQVQERIQRREDEQRQRARLDELKAEAQAARVPVPVLSPRSPVPITLKFADQSLQKILDSLGKLAGVNIVFDSDFKDKRWSLDVANVTFEQALDQITTLNGLFYKVLDQNTVIIVPENARKHRTYDDILVRTFYLENAEVNETLTIVKTVGGTTIKAVGNPTLAAITVSGTPDEIALVQKIIEANDKAKGEVMVEVEILEVNRTQLKRYGIELSNYEGSVTFSPTGNTNETSGGFTTVRAHLLSSLNLSDFVVNIPSTLLARFLQTDSSVRLLASPRLRAAEGKKTSLRIGTEVPIPITTFTAASAGTTTFAPATQFQYRNVGVSMDLTPKVTASGDVSIELTAEFSSIGDDRNVGTGQNPLVVPTFLTRNVTGTLRLKDGETSLIGGLLSGRDADSFRGALGLQSIPILNKIFTSRQKGNDELEVIISITPHVVRGPKLTEEDLASLHIGTRESVRVGSARSLFGEEEAEPGSGAEPSPSPAPPGSPSTRPTVAPPQPPRGAPEEEEGGAGEAEVEEGADETVATTPAAAPKAPAPGARTAPAAPTPPPTAMRALFSPPQLRLRSGEMGAVSLVLLGASGITAVEAVVAYDASVLEAVEVAPGSLLTLDGASVGTERNLQAGRVRVRFTRASPTSGSGAVATIQFRALKPGSGEVAMVSLVAVTPGGEERPALPPGGRIEVAP
jgi:general secretion pathway protein D